MLTQDLSAAAVAVRRNTLLAIHSAGSGHPGGALSVVEILTFLGLSELGWGRPPGTVKKHLVLSKGHACPALYAVAAEAGLLLEEELLSLRKLGSALQGHPDVSRLPFVEASTGSLGQGFSAAIGMAMGHRYLDQEAEVYVVLGDGELQEGQVWEGAMCAAHHQVDTLCAIVDYNKLQSDDWNASILGLEPLAAKWRAFGWHVLEVDGHDFDRLAAAVREFKEYRGAPTVIIAHTVKGKGVSFMEGSPAWHGSVKLRDSELEQALSELSVTH